MTPRETLDALAASTRSTPVEGLVQLYDSLTAVGEGEMLGAWSGGVFRTGHKGEAELGKVGWIGKTFHDRDRVDPIVVRGSEGQRVASDLMGRARLREVRHRGVVTATMIYDKQPIFDHFRRVDDTTLLGWMDRKGDAMPLLFWLRRLG